MAFLFLMRNKNFDDITLEDLGFIQLLEWLGEFAIEKTASERIANLNPSSDFEVIKKELQEVKELHQIYTENEAFPSLYFHELKSEIRLLGIKNSAIDIEGILKIRQASHVVNQLLNYFKNKKDYPYLSLLVNHAVFTKEIIEIIQQIIVKEEIKDDATETLFTIRQEIKGIRIKINRNFDREATKYQKEGYLGEIKETFVNDRRVLAVISSFKRNVKGNILGSSKTGSLTFIEPAVNIPLNNELESLLDDERKEIYHILVELTARLAVHKELIEAYQLILTEMDFIQAKARLAIEINADLPAISDSPHIEMIDAYHPILRRNNTLLKKKTHSQTISLEKGRRILVISGPNAGGKSITLKTIGLNQLMIQSGMLVPMNPNSKMCLFQQVITDVGDRQSIENELSTYSYRLKRMKYFLKVSNYRTLLLLDEFGTGSDPDLGGALAEVIFERLYQTKCFAVLTTHYSNIKLKADQLKNAVNGCMLFDTNTLEPLYQFSMGQPGSSFTFEVAEMIGISKEMIAKAKEKVSREKVEMDNLLNDLQAQKKYLEELIEAHIETQETAEDKRQYFIDQNESLKRKRLKMDQLIEKKEQQLMYGEKLNHYIEKYQLPSKKKNPNKQLLGNIETYLSQEKEKREGKRIKKQAENQPKKETIKNTKISLQTDKIQIGSQVKMIDSKQVGIVEEMKEKELTVIFGSLKVKVKKNKVIWIK